MSEERINVLETDEYLYRLRGEIRGLRLAFMLSIGLHHSPEEIKSYIHTLGVAEDYLTKEITSEGIDLSDDDFIRDNLQDATTVVTLKSMRKTLMESVAQRELDNE